MMLELLLLYWANTRQILSRSLANLEVWRYDLSPVIFPARR